MKKFFKFLFGALSLTAVACGAYYVYKNVINKDKDNDDFDDFEDDFEEFEADTENTDSREYVPINLSGKDAEEENEEEALNEDASDVTEEADETSKLTEEENSAAEDEE